MFNRGRRISALVGSAFVAVLATLIAASPADAATGKWLNVPVLHPTAGEQDQGDQAVSYLPHTIVAGNCRLKGENQQAITSIHFDHNSTGDPDLYDVTWLADAYTTSTWFGDTWHATFIFRWSSGAEMFRLKLDGPRMFEDTAYFFVRTTQVRLTLAQQKGMATVDWIGDC